MISTSTFPRKPLFFVDVHIHTGEILQVEDVSSRKWLGCRSHANVLEGGDFPMRPKMIPLSLLFARIFKLGATAYGGPAMIASDKRDGCKSLRLDNRG